MSDTDFIITFTSFIDGSRLLVVSNGLMFDGRLVATDNGLHYIEVAECRVLIVLGGLVVDRFNIDCGLIPRCRPIGAYVITS